MCIILIDSHLTYAMDFLISLNTKRDIERWGFPVSILWNEDCFKSFLGHILWAPFIQGTNSDGRHSWHSCSLPVNTSWVFKVAFDFCSDFLWQQPHASNESSAHCSSGPPRLSCAALYANPHNKRLELEDTCEPHAHSCSPSSSFFSACFLATVTQLAFHFM